MYNKKRKDTLDQDIRASFKYTAASVASIISSFRPLFTFSIGKVLVESRVEEVRIN